MEHKCHIMIRQTGYLMLFAQMRFVLSHVLITNMENDSNVRLLLFKSMHALLTLQCCVVNC